MKLGPAAPDMNNQVCLVEQSEMFTDPLPGHGEVLAKLAQSLAISGMELVEQGATPRIGQSLEN